MAHKQQKEFCLSVKERHADYFRDVLVLDVGALDINGNNHYLFEDALYIGVDVASGRNVDIVSKGHELALPNETFDVIVSTECFEHDRHYEETLRNICRMLKPGGMFLFTCATEGRPEHGTRRTTPQDAPLLAQFGDWADYYLNLTEKEIRDAIDVDRIFSAYEFSVEATTHDLYFWGIKKGDLARRRDYSVHVENASRDAALRLEIQEIESARDALRVENTRQSAEFRETLLRSDAALAEARRQADALRKDIAAGACEIGALQERLSRLDADLAETKRREEGLRADLSARDAKAEQFAADVAEREEALRAEAQAVAAQAAELRDALRRSEAALAEVKRREEGLRADLSARDASAERLAADVAQGSAALEAERAARTAAEAEVARLVEAYREFDDPAVRSLARVVRRGARLGRRMKELATLDGALPGRRRQRRQKLRLARDAELVAGSDFFDPEWYLRTYPDVAAAGEDPLIHYLRHGVAERRNPNPLFDTDWYLSQYPDVAETGLNPLVHYVARGAAEKRDPRRFLSDVNLVRTPSNGISRSSQPYSRLIIPRREMTAICMIRNELEVVSEFCAHLAALFDRVIIIDHASRDGTREFAQTLSRINPKFEVFTFDEDGYFQAQLMTWAVRYARGKAPSSWVFLLDADEFLPFSSKAEFATALDPYAGCPLIELPWHNLVPKTFSDSRLMGRSYLRPRSASPHHKIAFQPDLIPFDNYSVAQGNHALLLAENPSTSLPTRKAFPILHVPLRTDRQLLAKIRQGTRAYKAMGDKRRQDNGVHWDEIGKVVATKGISADLLTGIASRYGEPLTTPYERNYEDLYREGYEDYFLDVATQDVGVDAAEFSIDSGAAKTGGTMNANKSYPMNSTRNILKLDQNTLTVEVETPARVTEDHNDAESDLENVLAFLQGAPKGIETLTPTAWGGHIPFMFALMRFLRPQLYVELGSHYGASFFAACQAIKEYSIGCEAYAIDLWTGDKHTGGYEEKVFADFKWLLDQRYAEMGKYIRKDFNEAAHLFKDSTISLLHIDGLHTYEAVRNDYETWLPKMAPNGVILFHDTIEHRDDFGVWRFWAEIENDYDSFNFQHTHGLGVITLSKDSNEPVVRLLRSVNRSRANQILFSSFFESLGALAVSDAFARMNARPSE